MKDLIIVSTPPDCFGDMGSANWFVYPKMDVYDFPIVSRHQLEPWPIVGLDLGEPQEVNFKIRSTAHLDAIRKETGGDFIFNPTTGMVTLIAYFIYSR